MIKPVPMRQRTAVSTAFFLNIGPSFNKYTKIYGTAQNIGWYPNAEEKSSRNADNIARVIPHPGHGVFRKYRNRHGISSSEKIHIVARYAAISKSFAVKCDFFINYRLVEMYLHNFTPKTRNMQ